MEKHNAPLTCILSVTLFGKSPSVILARCTLGKKHGCKKCTNCKHYVPEIYKSGFIEGLKRGERLKLITLENGNIKFIKTEEVNKVGEYEIIRKSKVTEYIQTGQKFFICDMSRKKVYSSDDLRLSDLAEKLDRDDTFIFKEV